MWGIGEYVLISSRLNLSLVCLHRKGGEQMPYSVEELEQFERQKSHSLSQRLSSLRR